MIYSHNRVDVHVNRLVIAISRMVDRLVVEEDRCPIHVIARPLVHHSCSLDGPHVPH